MQCTFYAPWFVARELFKTNVSKFQKKKFGAQICGFCWKFEPQTNSKKKFNNNNLPRQLVLSDTICCITDVATIFGLLEHKQKIQCSEGFSYQLQKCTTEMLEYFQIFL
jgi:hypothetical protein